MSNNIVVLFNLIPTKNKINYRKIKTHGFAIINRDNEG